MGQDPKNEKIIRYDNAGEQPVVVDGHGLQSKASSPTEARSILGMKRKTFFILLSVMVVIILAVAIGGGVGGTMAARNRKQAATTTPMPNSSPIIP